MWRLFPMTRIYADASIGIYGGLGADSTKVGSFPLTTLAGIQTLLSLNTTVSAQAGYTNGFYSSGPSYSAPVVGAEVGYRYSPLGRVTAMYQYMHQDSVNSNYFRDHVIRLWLQQMYVPFALTLQPELHFQALRRSHARRRPADPQRHHLLDGGRRALQLPQLDRRHARLQPQPRADGLPLHDRLGWSTTRATSATSWSSACASRCR